MSKENYNPLMAAAFFIYANPKNPLKEPLTEINKFMHLLPDTPRNKLFKEMVMKDVGNYFDFYMKGGKLVTEDDEVHVKGGSLKSFFDTPFYDHYFDKSEMDDESQKIVEKFENRIRSIAFQHKKREDLGETLKDLKKTSVTKDREIQDLYQRVQELTTQNETYQSQLRNAWDHICVAQEELRRCHNLEARARDIQFDLLQVISNMQSDPKTAYEQLASEMEKTVEILTEQIPTEKTSKIESQDDPKTLAFRIHTLSRKKTKPEPEEPKQDSSTNGTVKKTNGTSDRPRQPWEKNKSE